MSKKDGPLVRDNGIVLPCSIGHNSLRTELEALERKWELPSLKRVK